MSAEQQRIMELARPVLEAAAAACRATRTDGLQPHNWPAFEAALESALTAALAELEELRQQRRNWLDNDLTARTMVALQRDVMEKEKQLTEVEHKLAAVTAALRGPAPVDALDLLKRAREELSYVDYASDPPQRVINLMEQIDAALAAQPAAPVDERTNAIKAMVDRFLGWPLPRTFAPDCGISFDGRRDDEWNKNKTWPVGTNLFTADEARQMFEHCAAQPAAPVDALPPPYGRMATGDGSFVNVWTEEQIRAIAAQPAAPTARQEWDAEQRAKVSAAYMEAAHAVQAWIREQGHG